MTGTGNKIKCYTHEMSHILIKRKYVLNIYYWSEKDKNPMEIYIKEQLWNKSGLKGVLKMGFSGFRL